MPEPGLGSISKLIAKFWGEAFKQRGNPELYVSRRVAEHYANRAQMNGTTIEETGEVIPKESV